MSGRAYLLGRGHKGLAYRIPPTLVSRREGVIELFLALGAHTTAPPGFESVPSRLNVLPKTIPKGLLFLVVHTVVYHAAFLAEGALSRETLHMHRSTGNHPCSTCRRPTSEPRKGKCQRCYQADYMGRTKAAACECCTYADARALVRRTVAGETRTLCGNCSTILGRRPMTLAELTAEVCPEGDRRRASSRRMSERRAVNERRSQADLDRLADLAAEERRAAGRRASERAA